MLIAPRFNAGHVQNKAPETTLLIEDNVRILLKENTMEPTTNQLLCKDGSPAVTYDGVKITPNGRYWAIPVLEPNDFEESPRRIPDKAHEISGREILENGNASFYTSTRERANLVAAEIYVEWAQRRVEAARHEVLLFEHYYELGYSRLNEYRANSYYEQACSRLNQH